MPAAPVLILVVAASSLQEDPRQEPGQELPEAPEVLVTASGFEEELGDAPWSASVLDAADIRSRARTLPEALERLPSVMVQKTAYGQSSPYIRGFTGFRTLLLVDGIRLNHSAMRDGPNQYWSTVDALAVDRLELVRGPASVLYGSDAIGGAVNALGRRATVGAPGSPVAAGGGWFGRHAGAEDSWVGRAEASLAGPGWGATGGLSLKDFNDLEGGRNTGWQPATGYEERDGDLRFEALLGGARLTLAGQTVRQIDVPRTHTTIFARPYAGTVPGSELVREHDQVRDLWFARAEWEEGGGLLDTGRVTLSFQRHDEERDRLRTAGRRDLQGFTVRDVGVDARFQAAPGPAGRLAFGVEAHRETVDSFRRNYVGGVFTGAAVQGPVADDSRYATVAAWVQDEVAVGDLLLTPGVRVTRVAANADRVANPAPVGPPALALSDQWTAVTGSLRGLWYLDAESSVFAGLSQGFRAPNLSDLTAFDSTSVVEVPAPGLDPEHFLQAEVGTRGGRGPFGWQASLYRTWIRDMVVRSPTGASSGGAPVVAKSNVGDGWIHGVELSGSMALAEAWSVSATAFWMDGEVGGFALPAGVRIREPVSRLAPLQGTAALRWEEPGSGRWVEAWTWAVDRQGSLSLRDRGDASRIPPGGTPGYTLFGLSAGLELDEQVRLGVSLENLGDKDYRVHGSGLNGPGRNLVVTLEVGF